MASEASNDCLAPIGETAGAVWHALADHGPMTLPKLIKAVNQPRDAVMQALGWLAREGKITIQEARRTRTIALR
jgi:hypothetical protein